MTETVRNDCQNRTGVWGDRSCPRLAEYAHCGNCPEYERHAREFLNRVPPEGYLREWAALLAEEKAGETKLEGAAGVFRLGAEWLALPARLLAEVVAVRPVRRIPHRENNTVLGLVSVRGAITPCISLAHLLGVEEKEATPETRRATPRFLVVHKNNAGWVFPVDEVEGIRRYREADVLPLPVTVSKAMTRFSTGVLSLEERMVGLLDEERLFGALERALL